MNKTNIDYRSPLVKDNSYLDGSQSQKHPRPDRTWMDWQNSPTYGLLLDDINPPLPRIVFFPFLPYPGATCQKPDLPTSMRLGLKWSELR